MEKAVLLLAFALQVFLLVSSFTLTHGATMRTDEEYSPEGTERRNIRKGGNRWRKCSRDGLCVRFDGDAVYHDMHPPPPPPPPRPDSNEKTDETETEVDELRGNHRFRVTSNCSRRPGGCLMPQVPYDPRLHGPPPPGPELNPSFEGEMVEMRPRGYPSPLGYPRGYPRHRRPTSNCSWRPGGCVPGLPGFPGPKLDSSEDVETMTPDPF